MSETMRAALLFAPRDMRVVDWPMPTPADDEVLLRVACYSPYGTDVGHYIDRGGRYARTYPIGVGADFSGVVESVGAAVTGFAPGDRVSALALNHCGDCPNCDAGKTNLCLRRDVATRPRQACCQQYTVVAANKLAKLPDAVSFTDAAMLAGSVVALNAFEIMDVRADDRLAVIGVGAMGLAAVATARARGIETVAIGGTGARVGMAATLGATHVIGLAAHGEIVTDKALAFQPDGFTHVLETTATDWGLTQAFAIAAIEGRVGITGGASLPGAAWDVVIRELKLFGISAGHHQQQVHELIAEGRLDMKPIITGRYTLDDAPDVFDLLAGAAASDVGRVMIDVDSDLMAPERMAAA